MVERITDEMVEAVYSGVRMVGFHEVQQTLISALAAGWQPPNHYHCMGGCEKAAGVLVCVNCGSPFEPCTPQICPGDSNVTTHDACWLPPPTEDEPERVAKSLCWQDGCKFTSCLKASACSDLANECWIAWLPPARAAIAALRGEAK